VKARSLGIIFIAAVILPSILLAVLSIRAAGREEAYVEKQLATTLLAEVIQTSSLANAEVNRVVDELRAGVEVPASADYGRILLRWKQNELVAVPFLLSPRFGILWPRRDGAANAEEKRFLRENGDFLSDRAATTVLQNIAVRYQAEILAEAGKTDSSSRKSARGAAVDRLRSEARSAGESPAPAAEADASSARSTSLSSAAKETEPGSAGSPQQMAIDAFAQSPEIQTRVYEEAREKGDTVSPRVAQPLARMAQNAAPLEVKPEILSKDTEPAGAVAGPPPGAPPAAAGAVQAQAPAKAAPAAQQAASAAPAALPARTAEGPGSPAPGRAGGGQQSQFVVTSRLLSQIASEGDFGLIPRFIGDRLVFLFWKKEKDGRIAGCEVSSAALHRRVAGVLAATWTPVRVITILDENGAPLATPPDPVGINWRQPFVAREIGELLPRWEAASYLTSPDAISNRARASSMVVWVLVLILFVSVAGGGTMVLSSMYGEIRLAQKKATFVANVSHELKTPLTSISLFVELLRRARPPSAAKREQYLALMAAETERLTRLINNVLDFSAGSARAARKGGGEKYAKKTVDAALIAGEIVESQRVRLERLGFLLTVAADRSDTTVRADPEALKQVILNLLSNAEKYSPDRKEIAVEVTRAPSLRAAASRPARPGAGGGPREGARPAGAASVLIRVRDRGIGVAPKDRERIFREFFRVDDSLSSRVRGTGLGLTIARRIVKDHAGEITCVAREGGGSDFIVRLPAEGEEAT
jgi:signal transduction histidine kinase